MIISNGSGTDDGTGPDARFQGPNDITTDGTNLYLVDKWLQNCKIVIATAEVTTLAGSGSQGSADSDTERAQLLINHTESRRMANLYVADTNNPRSAR